MAKRPANEMIDESISFLQTTKRSKSELRGNTPRILIDLHDDCLREIYKYLDLKDLLSVIQVNDRFKESINSLFVQKYSNKLVKITFSDYDVEKLDVHVLKAMPIITPFLQYFGPSIPKLVVALVVAFDEKKSEESLAIEESILKYCDGLKELKLQHCRKGAFDAIVKPFNSLEVFRFHNGYLGENISQFNKWFPKLRSLKISHAIVANKFCIEETMPSLEHLDIKIGSASKKFSCANIDGAICSNPQTKF